MADLIREAVRGRFVDKPRAMSRHGGAFSSAVSDTANDVDKALEETGFGER